MVFVGYIIVKNRLLVRVKMGIPLLVAILPVPVPTRGYGSVLIYPRVRVDPQTRKVDDGCYSTVFIRRQKLVRKKCVLLQIQC